MPKRISLDQVQLGMKVVGLDKSWLETPFFRHRIVLSKQREIDQLRDSGVRFVDIETEEGVADAALEEENPAPPEEPGPTLSETVAAAPPPEVSPEIPLEDELPAAQAAYQEAKTIVQQSMDDVRMGREINTEPLFRVVEDLVDSALRNPDALTSLARLKSYDQYTFFHCVNTSILSLSLGRRLNFDRETLTWLATGALLHDIGKMKIPLEILNKPGRFTPDEFEIMKQHALRGVEVLQGTTTLPEQAIRPALEHHERVNGTGYPFQRTRDQLTEFGMIASVVDIYDAVTSDRVYHKGMPPHKALKMLYRLGGEGHLDQSLVERFIQCVGVYPVGSCVSLNTGEVGIVKEIRPGMPLAPILLIVRDVAYRPVDPPRLMDLAETAKPVRQIVDTISAASVGIDANAYLDVAMA